MKRKIGQVNEDTPRTIEAIASRMWKDCQFHHRMLGKGSLYPFQLEAVQTIEDHLERHDGKTCVVMSSRQTMKNHVSAFCQLRHLMIRRARGGSWIQFAPTYRPQIVNSKDRLKTFIALDPIIGKHLKPRWREGFICQSGQAQIAFLSADKRANVVGATADHCVSIDEAHTVEEGKYEEEIAPMSGWENAGRIMWGVGSARGTLLHKYHEHNTEKNPKLVLKYPWWKWAEVRPKYADHVKERIDQLGEDHPIFLTQYALKFVDAKGNFFSDAQIRDMQDSDFQRQRTKDDFSNKQTYVLVDIGGEDRVGRPDEQVRMEKPTQDSSFGVAIQFDWDHPAAVMNFPIVKVVDLFFRTGAKFRDLESSLGAWLDKINPYGGVFDARGLGNPLASYWEDKTNGRIQAYMADLSTVSDDCFDLLARVMHRTVKIFRDDGSLEYSAFIDHCKNASYELFGFEKMRMTKPELDQTAHIDGAKALSYIGRVAEKPLWTILRGAKDKEG